MFDWFKEGNFSILILVVNVIMLWQNGKNDGGVDLTYINSFAAGFIFCLLAEAALLIVAAIISKIRKK